MSAGTTQRARRGPRYRRRRPLPALLALGLLVVLSGFMWTRVFETADDIEVATSCPPPSPAKMPPKHDQPEQVPPGNALPRNGLDQTAPIAPQNVQVRVLNGNGQSRQASMISDELSNLGFVKGGDPANDPVYVNQDLVCHGQIRYGDAGVGAARTLSLIAPCAQLVHDERQDETVDLALGKRFEDVKTTSEAKKILQELKNSVPAKDQHGKVQGGVHPPLIDPSRMTDARDVSC